MTTFPRTKLRRLLAATGAALLACPGAAQSTELHSLFDGACRRTTGIMVHVSEASVALVNLDGSLVIRPREHIAGIAIHKTLENPLAEIELSPSLRRHLRDIWVGDDDTATFTGWATAFFDDLLLYFDVDGQTHVLDPEEIQRLDTSSLRAPRVRPRHYAPAKLAFPAEVVPCGTRDVPPDAVLPTRVIADRIKTGNYLNKLEERYRAQAGFEERTRVYAEPFLFDIDSKIGLIYDQEWTFPVPFYLRWSNGRPYRFQSLTVVGNAAHEWLPFVAPTISARSDVKSHFFNASFVGRLLSLPAGNDAFSLSDETEVGSADPPKVEHSYNYVLLMGADWWRLSLSGGASYLATRITVPDSSPRIVLAQGLSPTVRLRYQGSGLELRALYFHTRVSGSATDVLNLGEGELESNPQYRWRLDTVRLGATWAPFSTVEVRLDQIGSRGVYADDIALAPGPVALRLWEFTTSGEIAVSFSDRITVKGNARVYVTRYRMSQPTVAKDVVIEPRFGGALEFLF